MACVLAKRRLLQQTPVFCRMYAAGGVPIPLQKLDIGKREVVGFGMNGEENYVDHIMFPYPAIRFKEDTGEIATLRQKEKGDWKKLTLEEKKTLYRASFCQTMVEIEAPTGEWKGIMGMTLIGLSLGIWCYLWMQTFVYGPMPETITDPERRQAQLDRLIAMRHNPIDGLTSYYDYEKGEWKK